MMFMIKRGDQEFGPYSGDDIRQYLSSGNIVETDLVRAEGTDRWLSVKDIVGKKPSQPEASAPAPTPTYSPAPEPAPSPVPMADPMFDSAPVPQSYDQPQSYGQPQSFDSMGVSGVGQVPATSSPSWDPGPAQQQWNNATAGAEGTLRNGAPLPPDMNWIMVVGIAMVTCGLFAFIWLIIQSKWVGKIDPQSKATRNIILSIVGVFAIFVLQFGGAFMSALGDTMAIIGMIVSLLGSLGGLGIAVFMILTIFGMKRSIEGYFTATENLPISINPILTFFFPPYIFQYHFNRINTWKRTGQLPN